MNNINELLTIFKDNNSIISNIFKRLYDDTIINDKFSYIFCFRENIIWISKK